MKPLAVWQRLWLPFGVIWFLAGMLDFLKLAVSGEHGAKERGDEP